MSFVRSIRFIMIRDVAVVGAGPSGLLAAAEITQNDFDVVVLEEHNQVGIPDHCAGLLSISGLKSLGLEPPDSVIQNTVQGAKIFSPSGQSLHIQRDQREARVVDRRRFDQWLANRAKEKGVQIKTSTHVKGIHFDGRKYTLQMRSKREEIQAKFVCISEGSRCQVSQQLGFPAIPRTSKYPAYQYEVEGANVDSTIVEMFYGRQISLGFFGWVIPLGEGRVRVGLASKGNAKARLQKAMKNHPIISKRMQETKVTRGLGGVVLVGTPISKTSIGNALVIGDAAGHVKPTTGGGVILGGVAARIAGKTIRKRLIERDLEQGLQEYSNRWRALLSKEFSTMFFAHKFLSSLSDRGFDSLVHDVSKYQLLDVVRKSGDMDRQKRVILSLSKNPFTYIAGLKAIRYLSPLL